MGSVMGVPRGSVGILWSTVATVRLRLAHPASGRTQAVEGLRRSDLMDQVQVYIEKRQALRRRTDHVLVPDFFE